jgi:hypothetical protein
MTTKPPLQKILHGILHIEDESKQNYKKMGSIRPQEKKTTSNQKVALIWMHTLKSLTNKNKEMAGLTTYLSILTLNVNRINSPTKRYCLANWMKKEDLTICCVQETHLWTKINSGSG